jgi:hypothetical protein
MLEPEVVLVSLLELGLQSRGSRQVGLREARSLLLKKILELVIAATRFLDRRGVSTESADKFDDSFLKVFGRERREVPRSLQNIQIGEKVKVEENTYCSSLF